MHCTILAASLQHCHVKGLFEALRVCLCARPELVLRLEFYLPATIFIYNQLRSATAFIIPIMTPPAFPLSSTIINKNFKRWALTTSRRPSPPHHPPALPPALPPAPPDPDPFHASFPSKHRLDPLATLYTILAAVSGVLFLPRVRGGWVVEPRQKQKEEKEMLSGAGR